jgi:hypothetical protein
MLKNSLVLILLIILIILSVFFILIFKQKNMGKATACFKDSCFEVELAVSFEEKKTGLMFRDSLEAGKGMLFVFDKEGVRSFWMKNTLIPLDIVWIDDKSEVVCISSNAQPCKEGNCPGISSDKNAKYVLEINGGIAEKIGVKIGDKVDLNF